MDKIYETADALHKKVRHFFIGSLDDDLFPNIKTVLPTKHRETIKEIYFSTNTSSRHVAQFKANPKACVYFFDSLLFKGVMLKGKMEVREDAETKERFWSKGDVIYYPKGVTDPDYCILKFVPESGRFYQNFKSIDFSI